MIGFSETIVRTFFGCVIAETARAFENAAHLPFVRRLIGEYGIDPNQVVGTGSCGNGLEKLRVLRVGVVIDVHMARLGCGDK